MNHWTEEDKNKLVVMRAARVPFALIAQELGRTENACHTKFYNLVDHDSKQDRYMEILSDPFKSVAEADNPLTTGEVQAVGRAILRGKGFNVNGRDHTMIREEEHGPRLYHIHAVVGPHLILSDGIFDRDKDYIIVWLHTTGRAIIMSTEGEVTVGEG